MQVDTTPDLNSPPTQPFSTIFFTAEPTRPVIFFYYRRVGTNSGGKKKYRRVGTNSEIFWENENGLFSKPKARISWKIAPHDKLDELVMWFNFQGNPSSRLRVRLIFRFPRFFHGCGSKSREKIHGCELEIYFSEA